ncbi:MAG: hypothetical protein ACI4R9_04415 [Kiritimatiellia bacterium]
MKKLMIAAAVAAMTAGIYAGVCAETPDVEDCLEMTVKLSGKTATEYKNTYKTVQKISGKGTLVIGEYVTEALTVKIGKETYDWLLEDGEVYKLTVFGKNLENATNENTMKPGKTYSAETDIALGFEDQDIDVVSITQVAFGSAKIYVTKNQTISGGACGEDEEILGCVPQVTLKKYSGWFVGCFETCLDEAGYEDDCNSFDADEITAYMGGTWSATVK